MTCFQWRRYFQDYLFQYSLDTDNIGIMNMPIIKDEKRTQKEIGVIAQKKSMVAMQVEENEQGKVVNNYIVPKSSRKDKNAY